MRIVKTPMMMRREAELRANPPKPAPPPGDIDPAQYPTLLDPNAGAELDAMVEWLAHLAAGRIEVK